MKGLLWAILFIMTLTSVTALDLCKGQIEIQTNCTMATPSLICTLANYSIYMTNGTMVEQNNLTSIASDIYYFNFTQPEGNYVVQLCDGTTREIIVKTEDEGKMILLAIILLPILLAFLMYQGAKLLKEDSPIKIFIFLLGIPLFLSSVWFSLIGLSKYYNFVELEEALATITSVITWIFYLLCALIFIAIVAAAFNMWKKKKLMKANGDDFEL